MEDIIALIKAISYILWPICLLLAVVIFRKEIRTVFLSYMSKHDDERIGEKLPENEISIPTVEKPVTVIPKPVTTKITSDEQLTVEACKNISSGKYFVVLEDNDRYEIKTIAPNGNINNLKKEIFHETIDYITVDKLTEEQREKVYKWIENEDPREEIQVNAKTQRIDGYLPSYMSMLKNPNTEPSRMLAYIKSKGKVSWSETKDFLYSKYHYEINRSGSLGASLKALKTLGLVTINGQGDDKKITSNFSPKRQNLNKQFVEIKSTDFWFKIVDMLQQNWALIEKDFDSDSFTIYFIHDGSGIFDRLKFASEEDAFRALRRNGFRRFAVDKKSQEFIAHPRPPFYEDQHDNGPIYSSGRFWQ